MKSILKSVLPVFFLLAFISCKVQFVPEYNAEISKQIDTSAKMVDKLYLEMLETTMPEQREFAKYAKEYVAVEVELNSLLNKNKIRPLNEHSTKICEITLKKWIKYKQEHKNEYETSGSYPNGNIKINRVYMRDFFNAMIIAENAKKIISEEEN